MLLLSKIDDFDDDTDVEEDADDAIINSLNFSLIKFFLSNILLGVVVNLCILFIFFLFLTLFLFNVGLDDVPATLLKFEIGSLF